MADFDGNTNLLKELFMIFRCSINKEIVVDVFSLYPLLSFTYVIVCRKDILEAKTITPVGDAAKANMYTYRFSFQPTFDYTPLATIVIYHVKDNFIVSTSVAAELYDDFKNYIDLNVSTSAAEPGQMVDINVNSSPDSSISLLGIDKAVSESNQSKNFIGKIWKELELFHSLIKIRCYEHENNEMNTRNLCDFHKNIYYDFLVG